MAPTTRSSAPSTPSRSTGSAGFPTPNATPRRTPHCTKCHRPRAGHPRSGCPYVNADNSSTPSTSEPVSTSAARFAASAEDDGITEDLSSLRIVNPDEEDEKTSDKGRKLKRRLSVRFALVPEQTLASLCPTDSQLVERLLQPGMMSDNINDEDDDYGSLLKWRKTLVEAEPPLDPPPTVEGDGEHKPLSGTSGSGSLSRRMPGTLITPTTSLTTTEPLSNQSIGGSVDMNKTIFLIPDSYVKKPKPLMRTMTMDQRSLFLERLNCSTNTAPATLISLSAADAEDVRTDAESVGFIVRILPHGGEEDQKWVILGTDEKAVQLLSQRFAEEEKSARTQGGGRLRAAAGGALIGAVATWTGLAFS